MKKLFSAFIALVMIIMMAQAQSTATKTTVKKTTTTTIKKPKPKPKCPSCAPGKFVKCVTPSESWYIDSLRDKGIILPPPPPNK